MSSPYDSLAWQDEPQFHQLPSEYDLVRTRGNKPTFIVCTSNKWCGIGTHWRGRKGEPCRGAQCYCLDEPIELRWKGYLSGIEPTTRKQIIHEFTGGAFSTVRAAYEEFGTLRGVKFNFWRLGGSDTGYLLGRCDGMSRKASDLPAEPDIRKLMCRIWKISPKDLLAWQTKNPEELSENDQVAQGFNPRIESQEHKTRELTSKPSVQNVREILENNGYKVDP
jgi:hypothetical protein